MITSVAGHDIGGLWKMLLPSRIITPDHTNEASIDDRAGENILVQASLIYKKT
jgi:hypothetical protein